MILNIWKTYKNHRYLDSFISIYPEYMFYGLPSNQGQGRLIINFLLLFVVFLLLRWGFTMQPRLKWYLLSYGISFLSAGIAGAW